MKIINFWLVAIMALSFSATMISCSSDDDNTDNTDNTEQAKAIAGTYNGYSIGESRMFSDYLMGANATATITANTDGTINLVYKSGSGDFTLNNLTVSSKSFKGEGQVALAMGGTSANQYEYTLEGSVNDAKVLTLKVNIPVPMGGINIEFIQGTTPIGYLIAANYQYDTNLSISVMGTSYGSTEDCNAVIKRAAGETVDITLNGFSRLSGGGSMNLGDFTISGVNVTAGSNGSYTLTLGAFETETTATTPTAITGSSLSGTVTADGAVTINLAFRPGSMPMDISAVFTGSNVASSVPTN